MHSSTRLLKRFGMSRMQAVFSAAWKSRFPAAAKAQTFDEVTRANSRILAILAASGHPAEEAPSAAPTCEPEYADCGEFLEWVAQYVPEPRANSLAHCLWEAWKAGRASETMRAEQLSLNADWLRDKMDNIHAALCPKKRGTWQQRAIAAVEAAETVAQTR